jgi:hypothetical protein
MVAAALLLATSCRTVGTTVPTAKSLTQHADIIEAVFQYQISEATNRPSSVVKTCYLSLHGKDPPVEFLNRFQRNGVPVKPVSEARVDADGIFDEQNGILLIVAEIRRVDKDLADVRGGHTSGKLTGSTGHYRVVRKSGKWRVTHYSERAISRRTRFPNYSDCG